MLRDPLLELAHPLQGPVPAQLQLRGVRGFF